jgi:hypothetical protein
MTYHELVFNQLNTSWPWVIAGGEGFWVNLQGFTMENIGTPPNNTWRLSIEAQLNEQVTLRKLRVRLDLRPDREDDVNWQVYLERPTHTAAQSGAGYQSGNILVAEGVIPNNIGNTIMDLDIDLDRRHTNTGTAFNFVFQLFGPLGVEFVSTPIAVTRTFWLIEGIPVSWMANRAETVTITDAIPVSFQP